MECSLKLNVESKALRSLRNIVGKDEKSYQKYVAEAVANGKPTKGFSDWYAKKHDGKQPNLNSTKSVDMAKEIIEYYYHAKPDAKMTVNTTSTQNNSRVINGYTSPDAQQFAYKFVVNEMLKAYKFDEANNSIPEENRKEHYIKKIKSTVNGILAARVAKIMNVDRNITIANIRKGGFKYLDEVFNKENATEQDKNIYALFKEITNNTRSEVNPNKTYSQLFFEYVFRNSKLQEIRTRRDLNREEKDREEEFAFDDFDVPFDGEQPDTDSDTAKDRSIENYDNHDGLVKDFKSTIDTKLKLYLATLPRLNSTEKINNQRDFDFSNPFGVPDTMDAEESYSVLYDSDSIDYTTAETMLNSLMEVAKNIPGMAGFAKLVDDLNNDYDLLNNFYRTFSRLAIPKMVTSIEDGQAKTFVGNRVTRKTDALQFEYQNSLKTTIINADEDIARQTYNKLINDIDIVYNTKNKLKREAKEKQLLNDVADFVQQFFPTIDKQSIAYYMRFNKNQNGVVNEKENIQRLLGVINKVIGKINNSKSDYTAKNVAIQEARNINNLLDKSKNPNFPNQQLIWNQFSDGHYPLAENYRDLNSLYSISYVDAEASYAATELANLLSKFTSVKTELNSYNVKHNRSSDIINDSFITNLTKVINNSKALKEYGKFKFRGHQYDFSNILLEKTDEQGNIINRGLFRKINGELQQTEYAKELISIKLFNGATDYSSRKNAVYNEMSEADYITTAFINFFNCEQKDGLGFQFANYMMRTPSDAPKNFVVTAPRYSTKDLVIIENEEEAQSIIDNQIRNIPVVSQEDMSSKYTTLTPRVISRQDAIRYITNTKLGTMQVRISDINEARSKQNDTVSVTLRYQTKDGYNDIIIQGKRGETKQGRVSLENPQLVGIASDEQYDTLVLNDNLRQGLENHYRAEAIRSGQLRTTINENHPIFKQYKDVFKQELTDMNTALSLIFDRNDDGSLAGDTPTYNKRFKTKAQRNVLYKIYHYNGEVIKDGKLTGKVFHSDRFGLSRNGIYFQYLDGLISERKDGSGVFNLLYGGRETNNQLNTNANGELIITLEQETAINARLKDYIKDFVAEQIERIDEYKEFINNIENVTDEKIIEFGINYNLAYLSFNDIFEGDSKFYKSAQDELKRAKEVQGSGVPYGIVDITRIFDNKDIIKKPVTLSPLNGQVFTKRNADGSTEEVIIPQYDRFVGVTITNTLRPIEGTEKNSKLADKLTAIYQKESNLSERKARNLANAFLAAYQSTDNKVNDAQSYITFEEWIRRVTARGQFEKYRPLIEAIYDETKPVDAQILRQFIQVQKNFYYDITYNSDLGTYAPRQIKNAEFVLVPRFIKGTQLEQVYKLMHDNNIDQLNTEETSKAGKCNVLTLWDNKGNIDPKIIEDLNRDKDKAVKSQFMKQLNEAKEAYNYNYLYTQQETPQHANAQNKAAIQIMKKILDNISPDSPLYKHKEEFFKLYCANIKESFNELKKELNIKEKEDGSIDLDYNVLFDMFMDEAMRQGLDSNMLDYFTYDETSIDGYPETMMPLYMSSVSSKCENIAQAIFNNRITRQMLPGFHAAQVTGVGFTRFGDKIEGVEYDKNLRYHPDGKPYIEVMLPKNMFGFKLTNEDGSLKSDKELLEELEKEGLDKFIGYRIPTEGKQSVAIMKVVGFVDDTLGSTIIVPDGWVTQTGSDFDIDSIYGINFNTSISPDGQIIKVPYIESATTLYENYVKNNMSEEDLALTENKEFNYNNYAIEHNLLSRDEWSKENTNAVIEGNTRQARQNRLLENMLAILSSDESLEENLSRSNFDDLVDARNKTNPTAMVRRAQRSAYNFFDQAAYMYDAMSGAKLKAFSVSRDTFVSICNTVRPTIHNNYNVFTRYNLDNYDYNQIVKSFGENNVRKVGNYAIVCHNRYGWSLDNKNVVGKLITPYTSQTTAHILDAIKEGAIPNENDFTFAVFKCLPDIGIDYDTAVSFIMQPAVSRIVDKYNSNKSIYNTGYSNPIFDSIKEIISELGIEVNANDTLETLRDKINKDKDLLAQFNNVISAPTTNKIDITPEHAVNIILDAEKQIERIKKNELGTTTPVEELNDKLYDLAIALKYNALNDFAQKIGNIQKLFNPDKFGAKQSIFATNKVFDDAVDLLNGYKANNDIIPLHVNGNNIIEAVYPNIDKGVEVFSKNPDAQSAYPSLYYFLKYSSAQSVVINKTLFATQSDMFVGIVNRITGCFTNGKQKMTEQVYKDYQNYILNYLYTYPSNDDTISRPIAYHNGEFQAVVHDNPNIEDFEQEKERIFGYNRTPENIVINKEGKTKEFTVEDLNHPTEDEVNEFMQLSPAQKVAYIQQHFSNSLIGKYLTTNMFNTVGHNQGMQTIRYIEDNASIETVYEEFENTFYNSNPLIKATAIDLVKYAFIVEGYRMRRNAVNKVIRNTVLFRDLNTNGAIVDGMGVVTKLHNLFFSLTSVLRGDVLSSIQENFIRQSENMTQIQAFRVQRDNRNRYDLAQFETGLIHLNVDIDANLIQRYGIGYEVYDKDDRKTYIATNNYVRLSFNKKQGATLYRIRLVGKDVFLYPINPLSVNENSTWSADNNKNKYPSRAFYQRLIESFAGDAVTFDQNWLTNYITKVTNEGKAPQDTIKHHSRTTTTEAKPFDINKPKPNEVGGFDAVVKTVQDEFGNDSKLPYIWIESNALSNYISNISAENGSTQTIIVNGVPRTFRIRKLSRNAYKYWLKYENRNNDLDSVQNKSKCRVISNLQQRTTDVGKDIKDANIFVIEPVNTDNLEVTTGQLNSTIKEALEEGVKGFKAFAYNGNQEAMQALETIQDITGSKNGDIKEKDYLTTLRTTTEFIEKTVDSIKYDSNNFIEDATLGWIGINNPKTMDIIKNNEQEKQHFLKLILSAKALVEDYQIYNDLNIDSQDESMRGYIRRIQKAIQEISSLPSINEAFVNFGNDYLAKLSNDPRIQSDLLTVFDGYNGTSFLSAMIGDLQESGNPLVQIVTNQMLRDIDAKEFQMRERVREFRKFKADVYRRARAAGKTIDLDKIVDKYGYRHQNYNDKFKEEILKLRKEVQDAEQTYGKWSTQASLARHKYDKFKLDHTEQELIDDYYKEKLAIEGKMLQDGIGYKEAKIDKDSVLYDPNYKPETDPRYIGFRFILQEYNRLKEQQREIRRHIDNNGNLDPAYQEQLKKVEDELYRLTVPMYRDEFGNYSPRQYYDPISNPMPDRSKDEKTFRHALLYGGASANALREYINAMSALNRKYYKYEAEYGFENELQKRLDVIERYESEYRDASGRLTIPIAQLLTHKDYAAAKAWLAHNALFVHSQAYWDEITTLIKEVNDGKEGNTARALTRQYAKSENAYDEKGTVDARKLTDKQIDKIKEEEERFFDHHQNPNFSDRSLISNGNPTEEVYTREFYNAMTTDGAEQDAYRQLVKEINSILEHIYYTREKLVRTDELNIETLRKLNELYNKLAATQRKSGASNGKEVARFIHKNVDFNIDQVKFDMVNAWAKEKAVKLGQPWYNAWYAANTEVQYTEDGDIVVDENGKAVLKPNHFLYGYITPKESVKEKYIDKKKINALSKLHEMTIHSNTEYYYEKFREMKLKGEEAFNAWYDANHVFNPYTRSFQPVSCWTTTEPNPNYLKKNGLEGKWEPTYINTVRKPRSGEINLEEDTIDIDARNSKYKEHGSSTASNYKVGTGYDNQVQLNEFEQEVNDKFGDIIESLTKTDASRRFAKEGRMPLRTIPGETNWKDYAKEGIKFLGWAEPTDGYDEFYSDGNLRFAHDVTPQMPMTALLHSKNGVKLEVKKPIEPKLEDADSTEQYERMMDDYNKRLEEYNKAKEQYDKDLKEESAKITDRAWWDVMEEFMLRVAHFNAVQDNKYLFYYGEQMLRNHRVFDYNLGNSHLTKDTLKSTDETTQYVTKEDKQLHQQYINWGRRLIYDQYRERNKHYTKLGNFMQNLTSNVYMMLNITAGIANLTAGNVQIAGEWIAKEYFDGADWAYGMNMWRTGIPSYIAKLYDTDSTSLADAIVKAFNIIDFDEINGLNYERSKLKYLERFRNILFSPQAMGEHFMQNSAMFAMMNSHRLVINPNHNEDGQPKYKLVNLNKYIKDLGDTIMKGIMTEEQLIDYKRMVREIKADADKLKQYNLFRENLSTTFMSRYFSKEQKEEYRRKFKEAKKKAKEEFENDEVHPKLISQFKLGQDGYLAYADDSILSQLDEKDSSAILAQFRQRVISVNKKIHGVYDKLGAAQIERTWWGRLVTQYHKHLYPGIMKHWRTKGYYNEARGTIEKGIYTSLYDFIKLNIKSAQVETGMSDSQAETTKGIQNILKTAVDACLNVKQNWGILQENERRNILRGLAEIAGALSAIAMTIAIKCIMEDDDNAEDSLLLNLALYEADRMASESMQYNPFFAINEAKKMWSSPVAVLSIVKDVMNAGAFIGGYMLQGDDFDPYYKTGRFAGDHKLWVYIKRRIPGYRPIDNLLHIDENNSYYKLGDNILSVAPVEPIVDWITN